MLWNSFSLFPLNTLLGWDLDHIKHEIFPAAGNNLLSFIFEIIVVNFYLKIKSTQTVVFSTIKPYCAINRDISPLIFEIWYRKLLTKNLIQAYEATILEMKWIEKSSFSH